MGNPGEQEHGHPHQDHPEEIKPTVPGHNNDERPERAGDTEDEPFGRGHRPLEQVNPSAGQFVNDEHGNDKGEQDSVHPRPTPERVTGYDDEPDCPEHHAAIPADARTFPYGCAHLPRLEFRVDSTEDFSAVQFVLSQKRFSCSDALPPA